MRNLSDIIMHQNPVELPETATVKEACTLMRDRHVGSVLVTGRDGTLKGIFSGRDGVYRVLAEGKSAAKTHLSDVMTRSPETIAHDKRAIDALRAMWEGGFRHLPVTRDGRVIGVIARGDFKGTEQTRLDDERELWEHMR